MGNGLLRTVPFINT